MKLLQRFVKNNKILINLNCENCFQKNPEMYELIVDEDKKNGEPNNKKTKEKVTFGNTEPI